MKILLGVLLITHGLIVAAQSGGSFNPSGGVPNPTWLSWWPSNLGQSWLLSAWGMEQTLAARLGGFVWLAAGTALFTAGLGVLGIIVPTAWWRSLALAGAALSPGMLAVYLHPFYGVGIGGSVILLLVLLGQQPALLQQFG